MNPVERRLSVLCEHWVDFRDDPNARLLIWRVSPAARRLVQCFVAMQAHEVPYASGDVLIELKVPYVHYLQYGRELKTELRGRFDASADDLRAQKLETQWDFDPAASVDTPGGFVSALRGLGSRYHRNFGHLCAVLLPGTVTQPAAYVQWVSELMLPQLPERLRMLVVDNADDPQLGALDDLPGVVVQSPAIDTFAMAQETFAQEPTTGPAGVYRNLMVGTLALMEKGTAEAVRAKAADALAFARKHGWHDQEVALRIAVAGALLKENRHDEALRVYENAQRSAQKTVDAGHPAGLKLLLQTSFGQGGVHIAAGRPEAAVACYEQAALIAAKDQNLILQIEAHRMTGWCHARAGQTAPAIAAGDLACRAAQRLKPDARSMTTAPVALGDMLRASDEAAFAAMQGVKADLRDDLEHVQQTCEARGRALATSQASEALPVVEAERVAAADQAVDRALAALSRIRATASPDFQHAMQRGDELLTPRWLIDSDAALPPYRPPPPEAAPVAEESAA